MSAFRYDSDADKPIAELWIQDRSGALIDFSVGYTFVFKIGTQGSTALLTKSSGITGAVGSGVEPTGTPNVTITWAAGELALTPGTYLWTLKATTSSLDRKYRGTFVINDVIA